MRNRKALALIIIFACLVCSYFINVGFRHILPNSILRWAGAKWAEGQYSESVRWFLSANTSALNAGIRWTIASFYIQRMKDFEQEGNLEEALENCSQAVRVLDGHDDEGGVSYACTAIQEKIKRQN